MKGYRFVRISGIHYPEAANAYYKKHPALQDTSYQEQLDALSRESFVYGDALSQEMRALGNDAHEILYDIPQLQHAWVKEHALTDSNLSSSDIIIAQLKSLQPDVVYFQDIYSLPYEIRKDIKNIIPSIKMVVVYKGYPGAFHEMSNIDMLLVGTPGIREEYEKRGIPATLLYHSFNPRVLDLLPPYTPPTKSTITFIGSSGFGHGVTHLSRYILLKKLMASFPVQAYIDERNTTMGGVLHENTILALTYAFSTQSQKTLASLRKSTHTPAQLKSVIDAVIENKELGVLGKGKPFPWPVFPISRIYPQQCHAGVFGLAMYKALHESTITINRHTDGACGWAGNLRLFEATGVGTCLVTDSAKNMNDLFESDKEVVIYSSPEECKEKIEYLLSHEKERQEIARAGQARTLKDHTIKNRCIFINQQIQNYLY